MNNSKQTHGKDSSNTGKSKSTPVGSIITVTIDTRDPVKCIQSLIGKRLRTNELVNHDILLQGILLDPDLCLYDQGVKVNGKVELSIDVKTRGDGGKLTITEISKLMTEVEMQVLLEGGVPTDDELEKELSQPNSNESSLTSNNTETSTNSNNKEDDLGIPCDPSLWNAKQVYCWMNWVVKEFGLDTSVVRNLGITGQELNLMSQANFEEKIPYGNILWSHFELLKKLYSDSSDSSGILNIGNNIGISHVLTSETSKIRRNSSDISSGLLSNNVTQVNIMTPEPRIIKAPKRIIAMSDKTWSGSRSGNNGQIQLWQFLLELLTDAECRDCITWVGDSGEFKLIQPELVAQRWGERKNKPAMNYEKLSRALRYYYDGAIISKVPSKRFVYKFICNLKQLIGYSAADLNRLVTECEQKRYRENNKNTASTVTLGGNISFISPLNR